MDEEVERREEDDEREVSPWLLATDDIATSLKTSKISRDPLETRARARSENAKPGCREVR